ncbi:MAG: molybdenum cofactor biosynthesis protein MoaE, partial [Mycobacterium sp.]
MVATTMGAVANPPEGDTWTGLLEEALPVQDALSWAVLPGCGGLVVFVGTVRDHAEGRPGVSGLNYEAYVEQVDPKLQEIVRMARDR